MARNQNILTTIVNGHKNIQCIIHLIFPYILYRTALQRLREKFNICRQQWRSRWAEIKSEK